MSFSRHKFFFNIFSSNNCLFTCKRRVGLYIYVIFFWFQETGKYWHNQLNPRNIKRSWQPSLGSSVFTAKVEKKNIQTKIEYGEERSHYVATFRFKISESCVC
jgi:hypothetical protein